ncbi:hypothetical protein GAP53_08020 [Bacteroides uniformis]|uniref:Uncharacterized protein n=1 Tax=Bacteroides uniformis TaxID=820 RepID=A0A7J5I8W5_BACUN|nr:hypothetical protein [Bacteroides uniformis]KAB4219410.1 hypothetical protein GAP45_13155 [Bacteroides uniformis]KAB4222883.1 hypothetical protein GAP53_08020 [Bacteroides uniformis]KAB4225186.1 hypothetical protein GAP44_19220 [Bacteroides uniformis]KAB4236228.1 hypothetical protein GAP54_19305 [Bacteroides uniformis]KAB4241588.1 hypothetical protein GAP41_12615 [Bacteroides uniformis]
MSHFTVMVIGDDPEGQLAPFDENEQVEEYCTGEVSEEDKQQMLEYYKREHKSRFRNFENCYKRYGKDWNGNRWRKDEYGIWCEFSTYNPDSKWDWYVLGGRWSGAYIRLKEGATSGIKGEPGVFENETGWDAALKGDIDFEAIRREGEERGRKCYKDIAAKCGGTIPRPLIFWDTLLHDDKYAGLTIEEKRTIYHAQEAIKIWDAAGYDVPFIGPEIEDFQCTEDEYAKRRAISAFVPYAVVCDYKWYGRGEMGWWGVSTNECSEEEWNDRVWKMVNALPDNTLISFYDCHI